MIPTDDVALRVPGWGDAGAQGDHLPSISLCCPHRKGYAVAQPYKVTCTNREGFLMLLAVRLLSLLIGGARVLGGFFDRANL